jgi:4-amino-4-deoxy-L-arabinose transferase-like glycosyltransferase
MSRPPSHDADDGRSIRPFQNRRRLWLLLAALFAVALAVRLPYLFQVPRFEDEGDDVLWALRIVRGEWPLTGLDAYTGPLFSYLVAGGWSVFGVNVFWPRVLAAVCGALTVPATFALGRVLVNARVGLVAALLALTSPVLVIVSSHFGWSNSLTPLFAVLTLTCLYKGFTEKRPLWVFFGGAAAGLTLQTHPLSVVLLAGLVVWFASSRWPAQWLSTRESWAALAGLAVGYAPMIWFVATQFETFFGTAGARSYALSPAASWGELPDRLSRASRTMSRLAAATAERFWIGTASWDERRIIEWLLYVPVVSGFIIAAADAIAGRRRALPWFLVCTFIAPIVLLAALLHHLQSRYVALLLPIVYVYYAIAWAWLWDRVPLIQAVRFGKPLGLLARTCLVAALAIMLASNGMVIVRTYAYHRARGQTNTEFYAARDRLLQWDACAGAVLLETPLPDVDDTPAEDVNVFYNFHATRAVLTLAPCPVDIGDDSWIADALQKAGHGWAIVSERTARNLAQRFAVERMSIIAPAPLVSEDYRLVVLRVGGGSSGKF